CTQQFAIRQIQYVVESRREAMKSACCFCILVIGLAVGSLGAWPGQKASDISWAFQPIRVVEPPADSSGWSVNLVDRFVQAKRREDQLQPADPADKRTLLRRVTLDLLGLPPTPEEIDAFVPIPPPMPGPRSWSACSLHRSYELAFRMQSTVPRLSIS